MLGNDRNPDKRFLRQKVTNKVKLSAIFAMKKHFVLLLLFRLTMSALVAPRLSKQSSRTYGTSSESATESPTSNLEDLQRRAGAIASSFKQSHFNPIPMLSNSHIQTIGSFFLRDIPECAYVRDPTSTLFAMLQASSNKKESSTFWEQRIRYDTPDKDFFDVDYKCVPCSKRGLVIILHGLESNSKSSLTQQIAKAFGALGLDVCCLNFRGCSGEPNQTIGGYHLGFTADIVQLLDSLTPSTHPIYLAGFSLGGNCVLKALGEMGVSAVESYNIQGAATFCVPLDNERNAPCLAQPGINRLIYTSNLLRTLRRKAQDQLDQFCNSDKSTPLFDYHGAVNAKTITEFDDAFIAPIYGFENATDYYRKTSSAYFLEKIAVPTLLLNSKDDPFMDPNYFPLEVSREHGGRAPVKMIRTNNGGHLGFVLHQVKDEDVIPETSWGSAELARFIKHVMESTNLK